MSPRAPYGDWTGAAGDLRFARHDGTALAGFDENAYAAAAHVDHRTLDDLIDEVRQVTGNGYRTLVTTLTSMPVALLNSAG